MSTQEEQLAAQMAQMQQQMEQMQSMFAQQQSMMTQLMNSKEAAPMHSKEAAAKVAVDKEKAEEEAARLSAEQKAAAKEAADKKNAEEEAARLSAEQKAAAKEAVDKEKAEEEAARLSAEQKAAATKVAADKKKAEEEAARLSTEQKAAAAKKATDKKKAEDEAELRRVVASAGESQRMQYVLGNMDKWKAGEEAVATAMRADSALRVCQHETSNCQRVLDALAEKRPEMAMRVAAEKERIMACDVMQEQLDVLSERSFDPEDIISGAASPVAGASAHDQAGTHAAYNAACDEIEQLKRQIQELSKTVHVHKQTIEQLIREKSKSEHELRIAKEAKEKIETALQAQDAANKALKKTMEEQLTKIESLTKLNDELYAQVDTLMTEMQEDKDALNNMAHMVHQAQNNVRSATVEKSVALSQAERSKQLANVTVSHFNTRSFERGASFGAGLLDQCSKYEAQGAAEVLQAAATPRVASSIRVRRIDQE